MVGRKERRVSVKSDSVQEIDPAVSKGTTRSNKVIARESKGRLKAIHERCYKPNRTTLSSSKFHSLYTYFAASSSGTFLESSNLRGFIELAPSYNEIIRSSFREGLMIGNEVV